VGNLTLVTSYRRLGLAAGVLLGVILLGLLAAFAVLLPEATGADEVELPDALPGGWVAADLAPPADSDVDTEAIKGVTDYIRGVYAGVYDDPVAFRAYTDSDLSTFAVVTVFTSGGGAFGPPNGMADPEAAGVEHAATELVRPDEDVVCVVSYEPVPSGEGTEGSQTPLGVSCQLPSGEHTIQLATSGLGVDETVELVHDVEDAI
jgi:hypothetical protein